MNSITSFFQNLVETGGPYGYVYAALIAHLGCLAFESQGAFASQR
jgi:hypothetical protein